MRRLETWTTTWEHPEYGDAVITWTWAESGMGLVPIPIAVQFGLWLPAEEAEILMRELKLQDSGTHRAPTG